MNGKSLRTINGEIDLPLFFPDATRAVVRTVDSKDLEAACVPGILVNTLHLIQEPGTRVIKKFGGVRNFMNWKGAAISDSGGFQVMSLAKKSGAKNAITDRGVNFKLSGKKKISLTSESSIAFQMELKTDLMVVLDDFTPPTASYEVAKETVERTILWAKRSKDEFVKKCEEKHLDNKVRPYLIGVVQGGKYLDLRKECTKKLVEIGFDGLGYGGWPITEEGNFDFDVPRVIAENSPKDYLLYGLGVGKPQEIVKCFDLGFKIFDCVLPTRDARHKRLYVYNADSIGKIDIHAPDFYSYFTPDKERYYADEERVSSACDCLLCKNYSRAYLAHLFRIEELSALRLSTIHNLRFFSLLMEKLRVL